MSKGQNITDALSPRSVYPPFSLYLFSSSKGRQSNIVTKREKKIKMQTNRMWLFRVAYFRALEICYTRTCIYIICILYNTSLFSRTPAPTSAQLAEGKGNPRIERFILLRRWPRIRRHRAPLSLSLSHAAHFAAYSVSHSLYLSRSHPIELTIYTQYIIVNRNR